MTLHTECRLCFLLHLKIVMLSVIILSVVMLSIVAPYIFVAYNFVNVLMTFYFMFILNVMFHFMLEIKAHWPKG